MTAVLKNMGGFLVLRMVRSPNDAIQKIEKTLNVNTHTSTQYLTNNGFRNSKKHPEQDKDIIPFRAS